jgi:hypothetical protein
MKRLKIFPKHPSLNTDDLSTSAEDMYLKMKLIETMQYGMDLIEASKLNNISQYKLDLFRSDPDFEEIIQKCQATCEFEHIQNIATAGSMGQWQASAWFLERKFPKKYGKKDTIKHEYEIKINSFMNAVIQVVNRVDPEIRKLILQELNQIDSEHAIGVAQEMKMIEQQKLG